LLLEQLAQQPLGRLGIAPALDQDVEHGPVLIDGAPEPMLPARDAGQPGESRGGISPPRAPRTVRDVE
jgi:hypothetical protein